MRDTISIVTSCSAKGWEEYGQYCIPTIIQNWPEDITVHFVTEDIIDFTELPVLSKDRFHTWPLSISVYYRTFYDRYKYNQRARGTTIHNFYNYKFDAWKFSKKVFAIQMISTLFPTGRLIWLDADVNTFKPIPKEMLKRLSPDDTHLTFLARKNMHSECGFVIYNLNHLETRQFILQFAEIYSTGGMFNLKEWHDSYVFDWLRENFRPKLQEFQIPHTNPLHPFNYSELGLYMDHWKGNIRKKHRCSRDHPRMPK